MKTPKKAALEIAKEMIPYVEAWDYRWDEPNYEFNDLKAALVAVNKLVEFTNPSEEFWVEAREFLLNEIERRAKLYKDEKTRN